MNDAEKWNLMFKFGVAAQMNGENARVVLIICEWDIDIALELFSLYPREVWTALPKSWILLLNRLPLDVRKKVLKDFLAYFPRDVFEALSQGLEEESRGYLSTIALRAFANSNTDAEFAQTLQLGATTVIPLYQEWAQKLKEMAAAPADNLEYEAARGRFVEFLNQTLPSALAEANPVFRGSSEDVINVRVPFICGEKRTALCIIAKLGDFDLFKKLLEHGAKFDVRDSDGNTALHAGVDHPEIVKALLSAAERMGRLEQYAHERNRQWDTALHRCRNVESARLLVRAAPNLMFVRNKFESTALHLIAHDASMVQVILEAIQLPEQLDRFLRDFHNVRQSLFHMCDNVERVLVLAKTSPTWFFMVDEKGNSLLHRNVNDVGMLQVLLDAATGAGQLKRFVEQVNWFDETALHVCVNTESARLLVRASPTLLFMLDRRDESVLHRKVDDVNMLAALLNIAREMGQLIEFVEQVDGDGATALHHCRNAQSARLLLQVFPNLVFVTSALGNTALHHKARSPSTVQVLLSAIEDPERLEEFVQQVNRNGETVLHLCESADSARLLVQVSPSLLFALDNNGNSALHRRVDDAGMLEVLLDVAREMGLQLERFVEQVNGCGQTALHVCKKAECARLLLAASPAMAFIQCNKGNTPLHVQTIRCRNDICRLLLEEYRVDVNAMNTRGQTALHFACQLRWDKTVDLLLEHSANIFARDYQQCTVLHYAIVGERDSATADEFDANAFLYADCRKVPPILNVFFARGEANAVAELVASRDVRGRTVLHCLAKFERDAFDLADKLILAGVNAAAQDEQGDTAMHIMSRKRDFSLLLHLIQRWGLFTRVKNNEGKTALDVYGDVDHRTELERRADLGRRMELERASTFASIVTLRLVARRQEVQSPWKRLPHELFRELCSFLV